MTDAFYQTAFRDDYGRAHKGPILPGTSWEDAQDTVDWLVFWCLMPANTRVIGRTYDLPDFGRFAKILAMFQNEAYRRRLEARETK